MEKTRFLTSGLMFTLALLAMGSAHAFDNGDFQVWHTEVQELKIDDASRIAMEEEVRLGDDGGNLYYHHYDLGYAYDANKHLTLGLNYRQVYDKKNGNFKIENRPHINATLKEEIAGFKLETRNRLEYRHFDYQEDSWRYRNKFTVKFPWKFTRLQIQPYLADEIFLNLNGIDFNRNRFYSGFTFNLTKNLKAEVYYLFQSAKSSGRWTDANVLGSKLKLAF